MPIEILPDHVVAQIAAGEVVERPASVVKELLENALDAGATSVHISTVAGGQKLLRVSDDGIGIAAHEVELAFSRHATSKLRSADDLHRITTLGFRGEALFSIASVSQVTVITRQRDEQTGTRLRIEGSRITARQAIGAPAGTVVTVENLFFNTPARLKFLKTEATEKRHITAIVTQYAMAYPHVRFVLEHDGREIFRSSGSGQLADVVIKALGLDTFKQMLEVSGRGGIIEVNGYTSLPALYRADRSRISFFVNGRAVQDASLAYSVSQAYTNLLESGRHPIAVLLLKLPSDDVDVNVHPTKAEVRFRDANEVFSAVQRAVRQTLIDATRAVNGRSGFTSPRQETRWGEPEDFARPAQAGQMDLNMEIRDHGRLPTIETRQRAAYDDEGDPTAIPVGPGAPLKPRTLPVLRVVGQVGARYIVAEGPAGLYLVDQHAAHERVLYEQFKERLGKPGLIARPLNPTIILDCPPDVARWIEAHAEILTTVGFDLEPFGPNTFAVRSAPTILAEGDPVDAAAYLFRDPDVVKQKDAAALQEALIVGICREAAVKSGQVLKLEEMQSLIRQLERCASPFSAPSGQATLLHMSGEQIAREFERA
jgi:DNA mismatch repair protein MutL